MDSAAARALASRALEPGEHIVWSQPGPWVPELMLNGLMVLLLIGFITVFILFGRKSLIDLFRNGEVWRRALVGLFFAMYAFGLVVALAQSASSLATAYAVTDRRVLVVAQGPWLFVHSYDASSGATRVDVEGDEIDIVRDTRRNSFWRPLFGVHDTHRVANLVRDRVGPRPLPQQP